MSGVRKALVIGRTNLLRQVRDRTDLFFVFVLPTIVIVALGLQFGGGSRARLGVVAPAGDPVAQALVDTIAADTTRFEVRPIATEADLADRVARGELEAGIVVPDGFDASLQARSAVEVRYLATPDSVTTGLRAPIEAAVARVSAQAVAAGVATDVEAGDWEEARAAAGSAYAGVPGVRVSVTTVGEAGAFAGFGQFTLGASTQLVLFTFLTSMTAAGRLVLTRQLGVSRRMTATPTTPWTIVGGETLGRFLVALLQAGYIAVVTAVAFNVEWGDPVAVGLLIGLFCLVAAATALLVGALSTNADQASSLGVFTGLALGALGGCMIPFQFMPDVMQTLARAIPHSWALQGLQEVVRGAGVADVLPNLLVLAGFATVLLVLGGRRFRRAITG